MVEWQIFSTFNMNDDWDIYESLKHENGELRSSNRRLYYFLDEIMDDVQYEHGFESPVYKKIKEFLDGEGTPIK